MSYLRRVRLCKQLVRYHTRHRSDQSSQSADIDPKQQSITLLRKRSQKNISRDIADKLGWVWKKMETYNMAKQR